MALDTVTLDDALKLLSLEFQDAEIDMMLNNVNRNLDSYEKLRKVEIPYDTEPAFSFRPGVGASSAPSLRATTMSGVPHSEAEGARRSRQPSSGTSRTARYDDRRALSMRTAPSG
jgi:hypothetical protein